MRSKKFNKPLILRKETIVNLSDVELKAVKGGTNPTDLPGTCYTSEVSCFTWWQECESRLMQVC